MAAGEPVRVVVRIKPSKHAADESSLAVDKDKKCIRVGKKGTPIPYEHLIKRSEGTKELYERHVRGAVLDAVAGTSTCVWLYGPSKGGKSFTLVGNREHKGLAEFALHDLCDRMDERLSRHLLRTVCLLLDGKSVFDLLANRAAVVHVHERGGGDAGRGVVVEGAKEEIVGPSSVATLVAKMWERRATCGLNLAESTFVMRFTLEGIPKDAPPADGGVVAAALDFVVCPGAEWGHGGSLYSKFAHRKDVHSLDGSLRSLHDVLKRLSGHTKVASDRAAVPFPDHPLTTLLKPSLGGTAHGVAVCCITDDAAQAVDSRATLTLGNYAAQLSNTPAPSTLSAEESVLASKQARLQGLRRGGGAVTATATATSGGGGSVGSGWSRLRATLARRKDAAELSSSSSTGSSPVDSPTQQAAGGAPSLVRGGSKWGILKKRAKDLSKIKHLPKSSAQLYEELEDKVQDELLNVNERLKQYVELLALPVMPLVDPGVVSRVRVLDAAESGGRAVTKSQSVPASTADLDALLDVGLLDDDDALLDTALLSATPTSNSAGSSPRSRTTSPRFKLRNVSPTQDGREGTSTSPTHTNARSRFRRQRSPSRLGNLPGSNSGASSPGARPARKRMLRSRTAGSLSGTAAASGHEPVSPRTLRLHAATAATDRALAVSPSGSASSVASAPSSSSSRFRLSRQRIGSDEDILERKNALRMSKRDDFEGDTAGMVWKAPQDIERKGLVPMPAPDDVDGGVEEGGAGISGGIRRFTRRPSAGAIATPSGPSGTLRRFGSMRAVGGMGGGGGGDDAGDADAPPMASPSSPSRFSLRNVVAVPDAEGSAGSPRSAGSSSGTTRHARRLSGGGGGSSMSPRHRRRSSGGASSPSHTRRLSGDTSSSPRHVRRASAGSEDGSGSGGGGGAHHTRTRSGGTTHHTRTRSGDRPLPTVTSSSGGAHHRRLSSGGGTPVSSLHRRNSSGSSAGGDGPPTSSRFALSHISESPVGAEKPPKSPRSSKDKKKKKDKDDEKKKKKKKAKAGGSLRRKTSLS